MHSLINFGIFLLILMQVLRYFNRNGASVVNYFVSRYCVDGSVDFYGDIFGKKRDSSVTVPFIVVR